MCGDGLVLHIENETSVGVCLGVLLAATLDTMSATKTATTMNTAYLSVCVCM